MHRSLFLALLFISFASLCDAQFVASKKSDKYHIPECQWAKRISESNLLTFETVEKAVESGYQPCKVCKPSAGAPSKQALDKQSITPQKQSAKGSNERCQAITKKGSQCSRRAQTDSRFCWQHNKN